MAKQINDKAYWKKRHKTDKKKTASGLRGTGKHGSDYIYRMVQDQYQKALKQINIREQKEVFDAGYGNGYFLRFFKRNYNHLNLFGIDISKDARKSIDFLPKKNLYIGDLSKFKINRQFDIVHCFDVLYHIINDMDFNNALVNLTKISRNYVIIHDRFLNKIGIISSKHVRMRRSEVYNQILNSQKFYLHSEIPTHYFAMKFLTYKLNAIIPKPLYRIDKYISENLSQSTQERLASHWIRIYKKY